MYTNSLFAKALCFTLVGAVFTGFLTVGFLSRGNSLIIGNYNSYMDGDIRAKLREKYSVKFDDFDDDEVVPAHFKHSKYDAAFVSNATFLELNNQKLLKPIDWGRLNLKYGPSNTVVNSPETAKHLFSKNVNIFLDSEPSFIKYGIPYFMSFFTFAYRGNKINDLEGEKTWTEILTTISKDSRFNDNKLGIIDDGRGLFALTEIMNDGTKGIKQAKKADAVSAKTATTTEVVTPKSAIESSYFDNAFNKYSENAENKKKFGQNNVSFIADAQVLTNKLAKKELTGALFYSGDAAYTIQGGSEEVEIPKDDLHFVTPSKNIYVLDMLAISKDISKENEDKLYKLISSLLFEGYEKKDMFVTAETTDNEDEYDVENFACKTSSTEEKNAEPATSEESGEESSEEEEEDKPYKYMPVRNFDFVYYTPVLRKMIENMKCDETTYIESSSSYKDAMKKLLLVDDNLTAEKLYYEDFLDPKSSTSLNVAYTKFKSN